MILYFVFNVYLPCFSNVDNEQEIKVAERIRFIDNAVTNGSVEDYKEC